MEIINTADGFAACYTDGQFDLAKWSEYIDARVPGARELCLRDAQETMDAGYSWEAYFLPVLNAVPAEPEKLERALRSFREVTEGLDGRIIAAFGKSVDVDVILYLGLCCGAGWVTELGGKTAVLLGIEKILELGWYDIDSMTGLIVHELGHVYQAQYGRLACETDALPDRFLWQLFTEGAAMVFEQELLGDRDYFHQDRGGWKRWCDENAAAICRAFRRELGTMTPETQRYFGDWVRFEGRPDTGYYLGARFVRDMLRQDSFDRVINYDLDEVRKRFDTFAAGM